VKVRLSLVAVVLMLTSAPAAAEWQFKPFLGVVFAANTTFIDLEKAVGNAHAAAGVTTLLIGNTFGIEADLGTAPGFFHSGDQRLVVRSNVTTLTGNVVVALPRQRTEYTLRPYVVAGGGLMHANSEDFFGAVSIGSTLPAVDIGGGVTGFLTERLGVNWEARYFHSLGSRDQHSGVSFGPEQLSFWRASMALAIRY
jgi:hypothetical protein